MDFGQWKWDVHSHLVPGVDDGAATMEDALDMLRGMEALGYAGMVVTPHVMSDLYPNTPIMTPFTARIIPIRTPPKISGSAAQK